LELTRRTIQLSLNCGGQVGIHCISRTSYLVDTLRNYNSRTSCSRIEMPQHTNEVTSSPDSNKSPEFQSSPHIQMLGRTDLSHAQKTDTGRYREKSEG